ncbi:MAG: glutathione peroxidase [Phycisphaerales bacterium]|nr:glutathione peroxidase [Phycisphaerales bacterium]
MFAGLVGCGPRVQSAASSGAGPDVLARTVNGIDGGAQDLSLYRGRVVLIVNVASRCGYTPQYESLESLYTSREGRGLVILGFPSNDFLGQEPGTNEEIAAFCSTKYHVTFPMFEKVHVKGSDAAPLFRELASVAGEPGWNFNKYLIDREGHVVARFASGVRPDDPGLLARIDALLGPTGG